MTLKGILDRKLFMLIGGPLLRRLGTILATYLVASGAPADQVGQLLTALGAVVAIGADIALAVIFEKRAENVGARKMLDSIGRTDTDIDWGGAR